MPRQIVTPVRPRAGTRTGLIYYCTALAVFVLMGAIVFGAGRRLPGCGADAIVVIGFATCFTLMSVGASKGESGWRWRW